MASKRRSYGPDELLDAMHSSGRSVLRLWFGSVRQGGLAGRCTDGDWSLPLADSFQRLVAVQVSIRSSGMDLEVPFIRKGPTDACKLCSLVSASALSGDTVDAQSD